MAFPLLPSGRAGRVGGMFCDAISGRRMFERFTIRRNIYVALHPAERTAPFLVLLQSAGLLTGLSIIPADSREALAAVPGMSAERWAIVGLALAIPALLGYATSRLGLVEPWHYTRLTVLALIACWSFLWGVVLLLTGVPVGGLLFLWMTGEAIDAHGHVSLFNGTARSRAQERLRNG